MAWSFSIMVLMAESFGSVSILVMSSSNDFLVLIFAVFTFLFSLVSCVLSSVFCLKDLTSITKRGVLWNA